MPRISQSDQILLLVSELLRRSTRPPKDSVNRATAQRAKDERPLDRVRAMAAFKSLPKAEARLLVVRGVLTERFGDRIANDPAFQQLAVDVSRMLENTAEGQALIDRALGELGSS